MAYLVMHIDLEFIVGIVCADNGNSYQITNGNDELLWLYFFNNPHSDKITFGKGNRTHFNNKEVNYYGRFFELIENEQETFRIRSIKKRAIELLEYSDLLKTLKDKYAETTLEKPENIPTLLTFSLSIGELAKQKMVEYLRKQGFQVESYAIPLSELVCYYPFSKKDFLPVNGNAVLLLTSTNTSLHLMKLVFSDNYFMLDGEIKTYEGKGMDPRKQAIVRFVVNEINKSIGALTTQQEIETEIAKKESSAEGWLKRMDAKTGAAPLCIRESLSLMPHSIKDILIRKTDIESDTGHYIQELMDIFDDFRNNAVQGDVAAIFLLGDCFHNSLVKARFEQIIQHEKLFFYDNRDLFQILSVYPKINVNRYASEEERIKAKARAEEQKKAEQRALEDKKRKEEKAEAIRIAAAKKAEENRKEAAKLYERAVELDKEGKLQDALANAENAAKSDMGNADYRKLVASLKDKINEQKIRDEQYKSLLNKAENHLKNNNLESALTVYELAKEIDDNAVIRNFILETKEKIKQAKAQEEKINQGKYEAAKKAPKWNPLTTPADRELFEDFEDFFPKNVFEWIWAKDGLTIKNKGENDTKVICYITSSSTKMMKIWLPCLIGKTNVLEELNLDYNDQNWNKTPIISQLTIEEAVKVMKTIKDAVIKVVLKHDLKLDVNRAVKEEEKKKAFKPPPPPMPPSNKKSASGTNVNVIPPLPPPPAPPVKTPAQSSGNKTGRSVAPPPPPPPPRKTK
jgi:tetratricopeptide (TPR) repeat protein